MRIGTLFLIPRGLAARLLSQLSVKMTIFYGLMFVLATGLSLFGTRGAIETYAETVISREMDAGSAVFDRIASMQFNQLHQAGRVLSGDFGFREAAATKDAPTIISALDSLKGRLQLSDAFVVTIDGEVVGLSQRLSDDERTRLFDALDEGSEQGIARWAGKNHMVAAAPIRAPTLIGWVVFSKDLGPRELTSLARLSVLDLHPKIVPITALPRGVGLAKSGKDPPVEQLRDGQRMLVQARQVESLGSVQPQALLLEYSLSAAMADYMPILWALLLFGVMGAVIAVFGSYVLAQRLARPIKALDAAARKVSEGEHAQVAIETSDEIGRLAHTFNKMVTSIEDRERQIAHMAFHDSLTGLANRVLLREHMAQEFRRLASGSGFVLFCLDLDNFKSVNDTLGHPTGDALLCEVANRLRAACPDGFVARLGGDEFAVVAELDQRAAAVLARTIVHAVNQPCTVNGHRMVAGTSIGIAVAPQDGTDPVSLLKNADLALYRAKSDGKGGARFFEMAMDAEAQARRALEVDLHDALGNGELELYFQPLFGLSQNRVTAFEALMRWNHPERGLISPIDFIPLAEDTGLIVPIGEWALREACRIAAGWPEHIRVAVNISPVQFRSGALNGIILQALAASGLSPGRLELEITESLFIDNVEGTLASLHGLHGLGVRVALDDFGTGYSSLSYLRSFPFDKIKIDRSFIVDLLAHDGATAIIRSIVTLADALGMETTAEGVENIDQLDILREQGCNQIQGYYFSRPIPEAEVQQLLSGLRLDAQAA